MGSYGCGNIFGPDVHFRIGFPGCLGEQCGFVSYREDGTDPKLLFQTNDHIHCVSLSPDGQRLVFEKPSSAKIVEVNLQTRRETQLVFDAGVNRCPSQSPDGTRLAYYAGGGGSLDELWLTIANANGTSSRQIWRGLGHFWPPAWSPDGRSLAVPDSAGRIVEVDVETGVEIRVLSSSGYQAAWAPNGTGVVIVRAVEGATLLVLVNPDGTGERVLSPLVQGTAGSQHAFPTWSPDGKRIAFRRIINDLFESHYGRTIGVMTPSGRIISWPDNASFDADYIVWMPR